MIEKVFIFRFVLKSGLFVYLIFLFGRNVFSDYINYIVKNIRVIMYVFFIFGYVDFIYRLKGYRENRNVNINIGRNINRDFID